MTCPKWTSGAWCWAGITAGCVLSLFLFIRYPLHLGAMALVVLAAVALTRALPASGCWAAPTGEGVATRRERWDGALIVHQFGPLVGLQGGTLRLPIWYPVEDAEVLDDGQRVRIYPMPSIFLAQAAAGVTEVRDVLIDPPARAVGVEVCNATEGAGSINVDLGPARPSLNSEPEPEGATS